MLSTAIYYFANEKVFQDFHTRLELRAVIASKVNFDINRQSQEAYENLRKQLLPNGDLPVAGFPIQPGLRSMVGSQDHLGGHRE